MYIYIYIHIQYVLENTHVRHTYAAENEGVLGLFIPIYSGRSNSAVRARLLRSIFGFTAPSLDDAEFRKTFQERKAAEMTGNSWELRKDPF